LDDSGKDPQNPITTVAGYIAKDTAWQAFEVEVEKWFTEFKVKVLHASANAALRSKGSALGGRSI
jgi:hypothetical protein